MEGLLQQDLFTQSAKVLNISSSFANPQFISDKDLREKIKTARSLESLDQVAELYLQSVSEGKTVSRPMMKTPNYMFSKLLFQLYTRICAQTDQRLAYKDIKVNLLLV